MEDRLAISWEPLTELETRSLQSVKDGRGDYLINRQLLAKLIGERERLSFIAESARLLLASCEEIGLERKPNRRADPTALEKSLGLTRQALKAYDGDVEAARSSS